LLPFHELTTFFCFQQQGVAPFGDVAIQLTLQSSELAAKEKVFLTSFFRRFLYKEKKPKHL